MSEKGKKKRRPLSQEEYSVLVSSVCFSVVVLLDFAISEKLKTLGKVLDYLRDKCALHLSARREEELCAGKITQNRRIDPAGCARSTN